MRGHPGKAPARSAREHRQDSSRLPNSRNESRDSRSSRLSGSETRRKSDSPEGCAVHRPAPRPTGDPPRRNRQGTDRSDAASETWRRTCVDRGAFSRVVARGGSKHYEGVGHDLSRRETPHPGPLPPGEGDEGPRSSWPLNCRERVACDRDAKKPPLTPALSRRERGMKGPQPSLPAGRVRGPQFFRLVFLAGKGGRAGEPAPPAAVVFLSSSSSSVFGQSPRRSCERARSARSFPPVWHFAQ